MRDDLMPEPDDDSLETLRARVEYATRTSSLRSVARSVGMSPEALRKFLLGSTPLPRNRPSTPGTTRRGNSARWWPAAAGLREFPCPPGRTTGWATEGVGSGPHPRAAPCIPPAPPYPTVASPAPAINRSASTASPSSSARAWSAVVRGFITVTRSTGRPPSTVAVIHP